MKIAVVILNYNGVDWLKKFLPTVIDNSPNAAIVVIDNASSDGSLAMLNDQFKSVQIIENDVNYGFAGGYNQGLKHVTADIFVLLNSDVEVTPNWIEPIAEFLIKNENCAGAQPKILAFADKTRFEHAGAAGGFIDKFGYPFCRGRIFDATEVDTGQYDSQQEVFWASGACLFIKSSSFWQAGGFDEKYFAHMEEIDLCWRLHNMGQTFYCIPKSVVYHVGGGTLNYANPKKTYLNFRNSLFTLHKNLDKNRTLIIFTRLFLDGVAGIKFLLKGEFKQIISITKAHFHYYGNLSYLKKERLKYPKKPFLKLPGVFQKSIVWSHFVKKNNVFSDLNN